MTTTAPQPAHPRPEHPRPEHPRPQLMRERWASLNGEWEFERDPGDTGWERGLVGTPLSGRILVPFAPESTLSGIGDTDFHEAVWYRRAIDAPADWPTGERILLHFQAVDHDATVWVNGVEVARHRGGFTPFSADITDALGPARSGVLTVRARDHRHGVQARGKQATWFENTHAFYTRTTGIWQPVWIESVPATHLLRPVIESDPDDGTVDVRLPIEGRAAGLAVRAIISDADGEVTRATRRVGTGMEPRIRLQLPHDRLRRWRPGDPHLYGLVLEILDGDEVVDRVSSYFGVRSIAIDGHRVLLNGEPVFQRLVLDQGYWPESLMTAPSDEALEHDIRLAMAAGFNGARVHEKVAEERYLYHADRLGFLVWGEFADWGASGQGPEGDNQRPTPAYVAQWIEVVARDRNHPSIVGWCPLNETYQVLHDRITVLDDVTHAMFWATKRIDPSRPVIDASGYAHRVPETDIWDSHDYEQDPAEFARHHAGLGVGAPYENRTLDGKTYSTPYRGQPYMVSEYGGIWWAPELASSGAGDAQDTSWGYGQRIRDEREFYERFEGLTRALDGDPLMFGYCYTQLTDVFQEQNGIYRFDRSRKLDIERIRTIQSVTPAYEAEASARATELA